MPIQPEDLCKFSNEVRTEVDAIFGTDSLEHFRVQENDAATLVRMLEVQSWPCDISLSAAEANQAANGARHIIRKKILRANRIARLRKLADKEWFDTNSDRRRNIEADNLLETLKSRLLR